MVHAVQARHQLALSHDHREEPGRVPLIGFLYWLVEVVHGRLQLRIGGNTVVGLLHRGLILSPARRVNQRRVTLALLFMGPNGLLRFVIHSHIGRVI